MVGSPARAVTARWVTEAYPDSPTISTVASRSARLRSRVLRRCLRSSTLRSVGRTESLYKVADSGYRPFL
ncbi:hypothetical protein TPB0596_07280 [Tsukamurella pulmonis]|nr:hypothetical protein TPB0596_07280 [Tsukamurella pulmonis]